MNKTVYSKSIVYLMTFNAMKTNDCNAMKKSVVFLANFDSIHWHDKLAKTACGLLSGPPSRCTCTEKRANFENRFVRLRCHLSV